MALENKQQVEDFADALSLCADTIHRRLIKAIKNKEVSRTVAQSIFQDESSLRQQASGLYIEAANSVVSGLEKSQASILVVVDKAKKKIKTIKAIAQFVDLIADLLVLATAVYAAKVGPIIAALAEVEKDLKTRG